MDIARIRSALIIDDHPLFSEAIAQVIKNCSVTRRIETSTSMQDATKLLARRFNPGIVFLDLNLPDVTGMSGFMSLSKKLPDVPIVVISATSNHEVVDLVRKSGGLGFIPKNLERRKMEKGIAEVMAGKPFFPSLGDSPDRKITTNHSDTNKLQSASERLSKLTPQQTRILQMICEGMLNKQIAYELNLAEATVKTHITAMMRKLGVQNRTQAALLVRDAMDAANLE